MLLNINTPYVPTASQLKEAVPFTNFDTSLSVEHDPIASEKLGKAFYKVTKSFRYYLSADESDVWAYVPAGFLTDGATVPRPFWWLVAPFGDHGQAAVLHDILCETGTMFFNELPQSVTRKQADQIFRDAMKATGVGWFKRNLMYAAVRGWAMLGVKMPGHDARQLLKRDIETQYMKDYGTYREPTAILRQVTHAAYRARQNEMAFVTQ